MDKARFETGFFLCVCVCVCVCREPVASTTLPPPVKKLSPLDRLIAKNRLAVSISSTNSSLSHLALLIMGILNYES